MYNRDNIMTVVYKINIMFTHNDYNYRYQ